MTDTKPTADVTALDDDVKALTDKLVSEIEKAAEVYAVHLAGVLAKHANVPDHVQQFVVAYHAKKAEKALEVLGQ